MPLLPCHLEESHLQPQDAKNKELTRLHDKADANAKEILDLRPGERVWIQHHQTKEWYKQATIIESRHMGRPTTEEDASSDQYSIKKAREKPQSFGATLRRQKNLLTQQWNQSSHHTPPFCPATSKNAEVHVNDRIHRPRSAPLDNIKHLPAPEQPRKLPSDRHRQQLLEMHWFWMVFICALLLFDWWKLRRYCKCPGLSKQERKDKHQARWNKLRFEGLRRRSTGTRGSCRTSGA